MKRVIHITGFFGFAVLVFFAGCVSAPMEKISTSLPEWVTNPPPESADTVYFVGSGSASSDGEARSLAGSDLLSSVTRYLGVKVTSETTVTARDSLNKLTSLLESTIHEASSARLEGFKVVDTYSENKSGVVNVYLLGAYNKTALLKEKARLTALFKERQEAVSGPEKEGDSLVSRGLYYKASIKFIEGAAAAVHSTMENRDIKYERLMNKAGNAVARIGIKRLNNDLETYLFSPFNEPFKCRLEDDGKALSGAPVRVTYKETGKNGRKVLKSMIVQSSSEGIVSFFMPSPTFVGKGVLGMGVDFSSELKKFEDVDDRFFTAVESLEKIIDSKRISFSYQVLSRAKEIPTGIFVLDQDNSGAFTGQKNTASGILEALTANGFSVRSLSVKNILLKKDETALISGVKKLYGDSIKRLVFGTSRIQAFSEDNKMYTVKVSGNIRVVDLETGKLLYSSGNRFKSAIGSNADSAISAAFKQFGKEIGRLMVNSLP